MVNKMAFGYRDPKSIERANERRKETIARKKHYKEIKEKKEIADYERSELFREAFAPYEKVYEETIKEAKAELEKAQTLFNEAYIKYNTFVEPHEKNLWRIRAEIRKKVGYE